MLGTRPDAIKLAPLIRAVATHPMLDPVVVSTGQHREMLAQVLSLFGISPDIDLDLMQPSQRLSALTGRVLGGMAEVLRAEKPDAVVVQGDTTTSFAAALAAFYEGVPVVHLEAGLRSGNLGLPFPEEANRRLTGVLTGLHLAPTAGARCNLLREGVPPGEIVVTGNTGIDALLWATAQVPTVRHEILDPLLADPRRLILVTAHRRESWGTPMAGVGRALAEVARAEPDALFVVPVHRNPLVRQSLLPALAGQRNIRVIEPLPYGGFCRLLARSHIVVTDSGGVQEEAPSLGKPVLVLRDVTERPEGVQAGSARLVGTSPSRIRDAVLELLHDPGAYARMANVANPYGDGRAAERSVAAIAHFLGDGPPPEQFRPPTSHLAKHDAVVLGPLPTGVRA